MWTICKAECNKMTMVRVKPSECRCAVPMSTVEHFFFRILFANYTHYIASSLEWETAVSLSPSLVKYD